MRLISKGFETELSTFMLSTAFDTAHTPPISPVYIGAYRGYGLASGGNENDSSVTFGRLSLGAHAYDYQQKVC